MTYIIIYCDKLTTMSGFTSVVWNGLGTGASHALSSSMKVRGWGHTVTSLVIMQPMPVAVTVSGTTISLVPRLRGVWERD